MSDGRSDPFTRQRSSARLAARWAVPEERARMLAAALKGSQKALEARGGPIPKDPKYPVVRAVLGPKAARKAFASPQRQHRLSPRS